MINVLKRLAELDSANPNVIKENTSIEECGPMGVMDSMGGMEKPSTPASMNITAGSGDELANMLATIMQLAGVKQHGAEEPMGAEIMGIEPLVAEPELSSGGDEMRAMLDKLNPMNGAEDGDHVDKHMGDLDGDGDHDMGDHELEKDDEEEETDESLYSNSPKPGVEGYDALQRHGDLAKNPAGGGDVAKHDNIHSRVRNQPTATYESLMAEYKAFVAETK